MVSMFDGLKIGDVVRLKFKCIDDLIKMRDSVGYTSEMVDRYSVGSNLKAMLNGGDFIIKEINDSFLNSDGVSKKVKALEIDNYLDDNVFTVYEDMLATLEVIEVSFSFKSSTHGFMISQIGSALYINGRALINDKDDFQDMFKLNKFVSFMEHYLTSKGLEDCLVDKGSNE